eukprot:TRINITY_DN1198_c1_g1_i1.p1 TRINITY_DN1198_c1_g1~~TRINITY_DN1198_c1_g1_i1.p1  ORF type:complete len:943 (-),score=204.18 TRINITY_DN1198_c1_g1_i1:147-2975(-)
MATHKKKKKSKGSNRRIVKKLGDYQIGDKLGRGAFGTVHKAVNVSNGNFVAIKQIDVAHIKKSELPTILAEVELMKQLHHPNIVRYLGCIQTDTDLNLILEYIESGSLYSIMSKFGVFPETLAAVYVEQLLKGLEYLHAQGVIHRDIKAANILITKKGRAKLADFGIATKMEHSSSPKADYSSNPTNPTLLGSPYWMAPEVIMMGPTVSPLSDMWSVGCLVLEIIEGEPPYYKLGPLQAMYKIVNEEHPPLPPQGGVMEGEDPDQDLGDWEVGVSGKLLEFLQKCFQKDANSRPTAEVLKGHEWITMMKDKREAFESEINEVDEGKLKGKKKKKRSDSLLTVDTPKTSKIENFVPLEDPKSNEPSKPATIEETQPHEVKMDITSPAEEPQASNSSSKDLEEGLVPVRKLSQTIRKYNLSLKGANRNDFIKKSQDFFPGGVPKEHHEEEKDADKDHKEEKDKRLQDEVASPVEFLKVKTVEAPRFTTEIPASFVASIDTKTQKTTTFARGSGGSPTGGSPTDKRRRALITQEEETESVASDQDSDDKQIASDDENPNLVILSSPRSNIVRPVKHLHGSRDSSPNNPTMRPSVVQQPQWSATQMRLNQEKIQQINDAFTNLKPKQSLLGKPNRIYIRDGEMTKICRSRFNKRWFFLFSDLLIYANRTMNLTSSSASSSKEPLPVPDNTRKPSLIAGEHVAEHMMSNSSENLVVISDMKNYKFKFHRMIKMSECLIVDIEDGSKKLFGGKNGFQIMNKEKSFIVFTETLPEKHEWMADLQSVIETYHEKQGESQTDLSASEPTDVEGKGEFMAPVWVPDGSVKECMICGIGFTTLRRRHHCRKCGNIGCSNCTRFRAFLANISGKEPQRVCSTCVEAGSVAVGKSNKIKREKGTGRLTMMMEGGDEDDEVETKETKKGGKRKTLRHRLTFSKLKGSDARIDGRGS